MNCLRNAKRTVLIVFCLVSTSLSSNTDPMKTMYEPFCKLITTPSNPPDKSVLKLKGPLLNNYGLGSTSYYKLKAGEIQPKTGSKITVTSGIIKSGTLDHKFKTYFDNRIKLENAGVVPKMHACEFHIESGNYRYYIAMEDVLVIANQDGQNLAFPSMTPVQSLLKILKGIKKFNDAGYYHNAVRKSTIGVDAAGEIKMIDFEYSSVNSPGAMNYKDNGYSVDAPALFRDSVPHIDTDDMYSAILSYVMLRSSQQWTYFFPEIGEGTKKKCAEVRDAACIEVVASRAGSEMATDFGGVYEKMKTSDFDFAHNKGPGLDKTKAFEKVTVGTLLHGLLNQNRFKLTAAEFLDSYEFLMNKPGGRILV